MQYTELRCYEYGADVAEGREKAPRQKLWDGWSRDFKRAYQAGKHDHTAPIEYEADDQPSDTCGRL